MVRSRCNSSGHICFKVSSSTKRESSHLPAFTSSFLYKEWAETCTRLPYFSKKKQVTCHLQSELLVFSYNYPISSFSRPNLIHPADIDIMILIWRQWKGHTFFFLHYKKCHFCHLLPFAKIGQKEWGNRRKGGW